MPPKTAARPQLSQEAFLAVCFKCLKEKPVVDYARVAEITGLSVGGAANKFRQVMKEAESEYGVEARPAGAVDTPVAKAKATTKKRKAKAEDEDADDAGEVSGDQKSTVKKGRATKKATSKATKKIIKEADKVESDEEPAEGGLPTPEK